MRKFLIILISSILIFSCYALPVFAVNGLTIDSYLSEPVPSDSVAYYAIGGSASDARLYAFFVNPQEGKIQIEQNFENGIYNFTIYVRKPDGSLRQDFSFWIGRYNLVDGTCYELRFFPASGSTGHGTYHMVTLSSDSSYSNKPYFWYSGNVTCENANGLLPDSSFTPSLMHISWEGTGQQLNALEQDIAAMQLVINGIYSRVDLSYQDLEAILQNLTTHFTWFRTTYYNTITDHWDITNYDLSTIIGILLSMVQGNTETQPDQSEFNNSVDSYIDSEHQYIQNFDSNLDNIGDSFDSAASDLGSFSNAFAFIGDVFNSFIPAGSLPYIFIFMSLTFGIIVLILGKQRS